MSRERPRLGLALGGGLARGLAHIGVLDELESHGMSPDLLAGTSAGSLVAALYASGLKGDRLKRIALQVGWQDLVTPSFSRLGLFNTEKLGRFVERHCGISRLEATEIPCLVICCDLLSGEEMVYRRGKLGAVVRSSCSIPAIFEPVAYRERLLVDGGVVNNVPVNSLPSDESYVNVACNVSPYSPLKREPDNIVEVAWESMQIMRHATIQDDLPGADLVLTPETSSVGPLELDRAQELIEAGRASVSENLDLLLSLLKP